MKKPLYSAYSLTLVDETVTSDSRAKVSSGERRGVLARDRSASEFIAATPEKQSVVEVIVLVIVLVYGCKEREEGRKEEKREREKRKRRGKMKNSEKRERRVNFFFFFFDFCSFCDCSVHLSWWRLPKRETLCEQIRED